MSGPSGEGVPLVSSHPLAFLSIFVAPLQQAQRGVLDNIRDIRFRLSEETAVDYLADEDE